MQITNLLAFVFFANDIRKSIQKLYELNKMKSYAVVNKAVLVFISDTLVSSSND